MIKFCLGFWHTFTGAGFRPFFMTFDERAAYDRGANLALKLVGPFHE